MKALPLVAAALAALATTPLAQADDAAVTVVTPDPGDVTIVDADPGSLVPVPDPEVAVTAPVIGDAAAAPAATVTVAPPRTATVVYVYPTTPQLFVPVARLPSFLIQPGAALPEIANYVVQSVPIPVLAGDPTVAASADLDCADLGGPVFVGAADPHHLDRNGNGIGCEPDDR